MLILQRLQTVTQSTSLLRSVQIENVLIWRGGGHKCRFNRGYKQSPNVMRDKYLKTMSNLFK